MLSHDDLDILEEHSHSPRLVYSMVHLRGISHFNFNCFTIYLLMDMDLDLDGYLVLEGSFEEG